MRLKTHKTIEMSPPISVYDASYRLIHIESSPVPER